MQLCMHHSVMTQSTPNVILRWLRMRERENCLQGSKKFKFGAWNEMKKKAVYIQMRPRSTKIWKMYNLSYQKCQLWIHCIQKKLEAWFVLIFRKCESARIGWRSSRVVCLMCKLRGCRMFSGTVRCSDFNFLEKFKISTWLLPLLRYKPWFISWKNNTELSSEKCAF